jgi:hypothetical protein
MIEVHTRRPEIQQQKSSVIAVEVARENRQAEQETQLHRPVMPPPSQADREERHTAKRQQHIKEELAYARRSTKDDHEQQKAAWTQEDDKLINEILGGKTEEQINAHNERVKIDSEKEQLKKEKLREEALKQYEKHQTRLAAMTPEEREEWDKRQEKIRTPLKPLTPEEFSQLLAKMHANVKAMQRKKAAWMHERDPRYDPMTGDLLQPDELPLDAAASYLFEGKTRPRRFLPPESPHLKDAKPLQTDGEGEAPESEYHERLLQRLLKAGFVEVEPTLADKASFEQTQWYRSLSPAEKMQYLRESMREMTGERPWDKKTAGEKAGKEFAKLISLFIDFLIALISPEMIEKANRDQPAQTEA